MSKTKNQTRTDKLVDVLIGGSFGTVIIYSFVACFQVLSISVGV